MLTKEESEIIDSYPIRNSIHIHDYIKDFIFKNPLNFPYSVSVMKCANDKCFKEDSMTVGDIYTPSNIKNAIQPFCEGAFHFTLLFNDCITSRQIHFTLIMMSFLGADYDNTTMKIFKFKNNIHCYLLDSTDEYIILIDDNVNHVLRIAKKYIYDINEIFMNHNDIESVLDLSQNYLTCEHCLIPTVGDNDKNTSLSHRILVCASIVGNYNDFQYKESEILNNNSFSNYHICRERCSISAEYLVKGKVAEKNPHFSELCDKELLKTEVYHE